MAYERKDAAKQIFALILAMTVGVVVAMSTMLFPAGKASVATVDLPDIKVYIRGEINKPGLYEIDADLRLCELIELAGDITENAELGMLNMAAILIDGTTVTIPAKAENSLAAQAVGSAPSPQVPVEQAYIAEELYTVANQPASQTEKKEEEAKPASVSEKITSGTVNINTAGKEDLMRLPGVGDATAGKIISYRESSGGFEAIEEIMNVSGIGEKKFEAMKQFIAVE